MWRFAADNPSTLSCMNLHICHSNGIIHCESKKLDFFSFEHNVCKYCPILIILSLLHSEIICPQSYIWINLTLPIVCCCTTLKNATAYTSSQKLLNKSAIHAIISLLLQSRKFWWYLLLTSSMLLHDVIITSYYCQRYTECLVTTLFQQDSVRHTAPHTCNSWTDASRNAKLSCAKSVASKQPRPQFCGLRDLGCHAASCLPQTNP